MIDIINLGPQIQSPNPKQNNQTKTNQKPTKQKLQTSKHNKQNHTPPLFFVSFPRPNSMQINRMNQS